MNKTDEKVRRRVAVNSSARPHQLRETRKKDVENKNAEISAEELKNLVRKQVLIKNARAWDSPLWWACLAVLRLLLVFFQTSYIHPDEFHQSLQVRARDVLNIEGHKPWEYTSSSPVRSIVFSALVSLPYSLINKVSPLIMRLFNVSLLSPSILLVSPRLFMTLLSFVADFCVYKIACMCYLRPWQCVEVFASSYVMLVYGTRTFSNTLELVLLCVVLWRVSVSIVDSTKIIRREAVIQDLYEAADDVKDRARLTRMRSALPPYNYGDSVLLSFVITVGVFIRPTFLIYTFVPLAYWLQRGIITKELHFKYFNLRCLSLLPGVCATFVLCTLADSFYYGTLTFRELVFGNVTANSFIVTPYNFFLYNKEKENLEKHGSHPFYTHALVNLPLLYGVLAFIGFYYCSVYLSNIVSSARLCRKPRIYSLASMLLFSFIFPMIILSCVPHQEARFLLPILPILVLLHSDKISLHNVLKLKFSKHFLFLMWHTWNIFCVVFFGFLHQGGVTNAMIAVHDYVLSRPQDFDVPLHIYFSHMYTPPTFLLMRKIDVVTSTKEGRHFKTPRSVYTYHVGGFSIIGRLNALIKNRLNISVSNSSSADTVVHFSKDTSSEYLSSSNFYAVHSVNFSSRLSNERVEVLHCLPASVFLKLDLRGLKYQLLRRLPLHVTLEDLPNFELTSADVNTSCNEACALRNKLMQFSLEIYRVTSVQNSTYKKEVRIKKSKRKNKISPNT